MLECSRKSAIEKLTLMRVLYFLQEGVPKVVRGKIRSAIGLLGDRFY